MICIYIELLQANPPSSDIAGADKPPPLQPKPQRYKSEPEKEPTLYEELLQLGDSIDIENVDFGNKYTLLNRTSFIMYNRVS